MENLPVEVIEKIKVGSDGAKGGSTYTINPDIDIGETPRSTEWFITSVSW
jgi:hypothetical protein